MFQMIRVVVPGSFRVVVELDFVTEELRDQMDWFAIFVGEENADSGLAEWVFSGVYSLEIPRMLVERFGLFEA